MRSIGRSALIGIILVFTFFLFGCGNRDIEILKSEYDDLVSEVISSLNQNDIYNSATAIQESGKLEEMKELLDKMDKEKSCSKKDEYDAAMDTYESISKITADALNWDNLSKGEKSELQLKITLEKSFIEENKQ